MEPRRSRSFGRKTYLLIAAAVAVAISAAPTHAATTTWWVTNQGVDSASCGARPKPCRSISAAIEKASNGDVIEVGAGLYGDLNGDGAFTAPGEEHFGTNFAGRTCIVCVDKAIKILSLHGADDTIIDAGNSRRPDPSASDGKVDSVVSITTTGATLGSDGRGFTITGSGGDGVHVESTTSAATLIGNIARRNPGTGFRVDVVDESPPPFPLPLQKYILKDNSAIDNDVGFSVAHDESRGIPELAYLTGNMASGNRRDGYFFFGQSYQAQMIGNVSSNNGSGVHVGVLGPGIEIRSNSMLGNIGPGILITSLSSGVQITGNTIVGNTGAGVYLLGDVENNIIRGNNIYGNTGAPFPQGPSVNTSNCGIVNIDIPVPLDATNNYWGSGNGPGPDPADNAGKGCDFFSGQTLVKPFATTLFAISP
jgi:parallel beta-helix repeat protein